MQKGWRKQGAECSKRNEKSGSRKWKKGSTMLKEIAENREQNAKREWRKQGVACRKGIKK